MSTELVKHSNRFSGKIALVVAPGPSALHWTYVRNICKPDIVCSVKQGIRLTKGQTDIHFFNQLEVEDWSRHQDPARMISIFSDTVPNKTQYNHYDLRFIVDNKCASPYSRCIGLNLDFDKYAIRNSGLYRPWGPTIMLETVLYYLEHAGVERIVTIGWDAPFLSAGSAYNYFYTKLEKRTRKICPLIGRQDAYNYYRHISGLKYYVNEKPFVAEGFSEIDVVKKAFPHFRDWLRGKGVEIEPFTVRDGRLIFINN